MIGSMVVLNYVDPFVISWKINAAVMSLTMPNIRKMLSECLEGDITPLTVVANNFPDRSSSVPAIEFLAGLWVMDINPILRPHRRSGLFDGQKALSLSRNLSANISEESERVIRGVRGKDVVERFNVVVGPISSSTGASCEGGTGESRTG
ncbi:hypothetical protein CDAR_382681 [Caerostris darwini]|uniref:Uncharacterized protein n=1 Tax=Caerostris darwini TaxID=1538125 RepID=A0AAV4X0T2_9ARAC|nr:hypothetical protein CDAR_382681 [Caerostris darwini]